MIYNKDSILMMEDVQPQSIHAVVTDPPYGIGLMNRKWDETLPPQIIWNNCFNVLKPGGFCIAFAHTRLYHRLACQIEDAGFIIKDCLCWGYATGFPHSLDIGKALDRDAGVEREIIGRRVHPTLKNVPNVKSNAYHADTLQSDESMESWDITAPATDEAKQWDGWGTVLKTAWEPIILAQKPLEGTYIENIREYKVGALNIDECRIPYASDKDKKSLESFMKFQGENHGDCDYFSCNDGNKKQVNIHPDGRWPANLLWLDPLFANYDHIFMVPKPPSSEKRKYNTHDTVKPLILMKRLIKLITPRPSVAEEDVYVLDPFAGSGSTIVAAKLLGRFGIGYEKDYESFVIMKRRLQEKITDFDIFER